MNKSKFLAIFITSILVLFVFFGLGPNFSLEFQFYKNLAQNDNHLNYANREYGYNFMKSAELNSIFMTEGGDNQVFSLLYLALAERRRPDIDFYDQKGNVFPRLYGDLLNTYPDELELIRDIRDFQLYSTGRPVYLTWPRANLEKLNLSYFRQVKRKILKKANPSRHALIEKRFKLGSLSELEQTARLMVSDSVYDLSLRSGGNLADEDFVYLGPWYFKRLGMVYRVTPIRYAIVDGLEGYYGRANATQLIDYVRKVAKISLSENQFRFYVNELIKEGYIEKLRFTEDVLASDLVLQRSFQPFKNMDSLDYWNYYDFSYRKQYNASSWDFLTREIFANYSRIRSDDFALASSRYRQMAGFAKEPEEKLKLTQLSITYQKRSLDAFAESIIYNYDNSYMMYQYGKKLYNSSYSNKLLAPKYTAQSSQYNYKFLTGYLDALKMIYNLLSANSADSPKPNKEQIAVLLEEAKKYTRNLLAARKLHFNSQGKPNDYLKDGVVNQAKDFLKRIEVASSLTPDKINDLAASAKNSETQLLQLTKVLEKNKDWGKLAETYRSLIKFNSNNYDYQIQLYRAYVYNQQPYQAIELLLEVMRNYNKFFQGNKPPVWSLNYNVGKVYFDQGREKWESGQVDRQKEGLKDLENSEVFFKKFLAEFEKASKVNPNLEAEINMTDWLRATEVLLDFIQKVKSQ